MSRATNTREPVIDDRRIAIVSVYRRLQWSLDLSWREPGAGGQRQLGDTTVESHHVPMVGYLNIIHPPQVQVIGAPEHNWLNSQGDPSAFVLTPLVAGATQLVVACDNQRLDPTLAESLAEAGIAVFETATSAHRVAYHLRHFLNDILAPRQTIHGVFLEVLSTGLLLTGKPGVGKSELALELINRGHRLVADDVPSFALLGPNDLNGSCPPILQDFLEVRGLGILDIRAMFGQAAIKRRKQLGLIIRLVRPDGDSPPAPNRLTGTRTTRRMLDVDIPEITLPVTAGHNLSVLVEAACRDHLLRLQGYNSDEQFAARQAKQLQGRSCD